MKIAVIGDVLIDEYVYGVVERISPEAPVPVLKFSHSKEMPGGAGNVYENIKSLTLESVLCTSSTNPPRKTRCIADGYNLLRVDREQHPTWKHSDEWQTADIVVVSDYNKGAIDGQWWRNTTARIIVDPKKDLFFYKGVWCLKPNRKEFETTFGKWTSLNQLQELMHNAAHELNVAHLIVTLGSEGVAYCGPTGWLSIPSEGQEVFDVTGAGDTFTAVLAYGISKNLDMVNAIKLANKAAGVAVSHRGTYVIQPTDIVVSQKQIIVFTNGCFDILHRGHIDYLKQSKQLGNKLIVGLNSDESIRQLKGQSRPVNCQEDRKYLLESFSFVDEVIIFDDPTPIRLIEQLQPDIITKGGDYTPDSVVGSNVVPAVVILPYITGYSTTSIIEKSKK